MDGSVIGTMIGPTISVFWWLLQTVLMLPFRLISELIWGDLLGDLLGGPDCGCGT